MIHNRFFASLRMTVVILRNVRMTVVILRNGVTKDLTRERNEERTEDA